MWASVGGNGQGADLTGGDFRGLGGRGRCLLCAWGFKRTMFVFRPGPVTEALPPRASYLHSSCYLIWKVSLGIIFASLGCSEVKQNSTCKKQVCWTSLAVRELRLQTSAAGSLGWISGQGTKQNKKTHVCCREQARIQYTLDLYPLWSMLQRFLYISLSPPNQAVKSALPHL